MGQKVDLITGDIYGYLAGIEKARCIKHLDTQLALAKNRRELRAAMMLAEDVMSGAGGYYEYDEKLVALNAVHAVKDDKGAAVQRVVNGMPEYVISDHAAYKSAVEALKKEYAQAIEVRNDLMRKRVKVELELVDPDMIGDDHADLVQDLLPMIKMN